MPTVPRNTAPRTQIDRVPGVSSVSPQGAEGLGGIASAIGRQASAIGENVNATAREGQAAQNVFESVSRDAVTYGRITQLKIAKDGDIADADFNTYLSNAKAGGQDPQTGQHIPGTLDAPFTPSGPDGSGGTGAETATTAAVKEWFDRKDGAFARLPPRAQEAFRLRNSGKVDMLREEARAVDRKNGDIRNVAVNEAVGQSNLRLVAQSAADIESGSWERAVQIVREQEAMRVTRHLQVDPSNADPSKIKWRISEGEAIFKQKAQEFDQKAAAQRVETLLQMADAVPDTPQGEAQAKSILDAATMFAKTGRTAPVDPAAFNTKLTPEEEIRFQEWKAKNAPADSGSDYDLRGAFKAGLTPNANGHWSDQFKKPNHPTFSDQSQYAQARPELAGTWQGEKFTPPAISSPLSPEQVAKYQAKAQDIAETRIHRVEAQHQDDLQNADKELLYFQQGWEKDPAKAQAALAKLPEPDQAARHAVVRRSFVADDIGRATSIIDSYIVSGDKKAFDTASASLQTDEGRAHIVTWQAQRDAAAQRAIDRTDALQNKEDRRQYELTKEQQKITSALRVGMFKNGVTLTADGRFMPLSPAAVRDAANTALANNEIDYGQRQEVNSSLEKEASKNAVKIADEGFDAVADAFSIDRSALRQWFAYTAGQNRYEPNTTTKAGISSPVISPTDAIGTMSWKNEKGNTEVENATADLVGEVLNSLAEYQRAPHLPGKEGGKMAGAEPMTPREYVNAMLQADVSGKKKILDAAVVKRHVQDAGMKTLSAYRIAAQKESEAAFKGGAKVLQDKANAPAVYPQPYPEIQ